LNNIVVFFVEAKEGLFGHKGKSYQFKLINGPLAMMLTIQCKCLKTTIGELMMYWYRVKITISIPVFLQMLNDN
jgi:hypothetical protein